jgi:hypothetical protein
LRIRADKPRAGDAFAASTGTSVRGAIYAFSLSPLSRPFGPFIGSTLKGSIGSRLWENAALDRVESSAKAKRAGLRIGSRCGGLSGPHRRLISVLTFSRARRKVGRAHPRLDDPERMFCGLAADAHGLGRTVQPFLPRALRNGAPFKDWVLPTALDRVRRKLSGSDDGDRQMVKILAVVLWLRNPNQLRRGESCRFDPSPTRGPFCTPVRGAVSAPIGTHRYHHIT